MSNVKSISGVLPFAVSDNAGFHSASGPVAIRMNNDYLFRALLQRNNRALKGLICSLLHLDADQVSTVVITNPIALGDTIDGRSFFLDTRVLLNDSTVINLEMQVANEHNWVERSLSYLCRSFDSLERGQSYLDTKATIQIGLLDFTLFEQYPEFYATYQLLNVRNHRLYSDRLRLSVVDLTQIDKATEEDRAYHTDHWASLFKATTWEEIKMLAQKDEYIREASETIYHLTQEEKIRLQCEAREDYYRRQADAKLLRERLTAEIQSKQTEFENMQTEFESTKAALESTRAALEDRDSTIAEKDCAIAALQAEIGRLRNGGAT